MAENLAKIPPQVPGKIRGHLEVKCLYFLWEYQETPPSCRMSVLVKWWGEQYKCCKICRVPVVFSKMEAQSVVAHSVNYCVCSSWRKLEQYLKDMGELILYVGLGRSPEDFLIIGQCVIPTSSFVKSTDKLLIRTSGAVVCDGIHFGQLKVQFKYLSESKENKTPTLLKFPMSGMAGPNENKWRTVKSLCSKETNEELLEPVNIGIKSTKLVQELLERAVTLHDKMVNEINQNDEKSSNIVKKEQHESNENITCNEWASVELTPPYSPASLSSQQMLHEAYFECNDDLMDDVNLVGNQLFQKSQPFQSQPLPSQPLPSQPLPSQPLPSQPLSSQPLQSQSLSSQPLLSQPLLSQPLPSQSLPSLLHIYLNINNGSSLLVPSDEDTVPNSYFVCKLFWLKIPLHSGIYWQSRRPQFNLSQIIPVALSHDVSFDSQYLIIEVWHCVGTTANDDDDELIGLIKVCLKVISDILEYIKLDCSYTNDVLPCSIVDGYCPVVDPFTGNTNGYIKVGVTIGTPHQLPSRLGVKNTLYPFNNDQCTVPSIVVHEDVELPKKPSKKQQKFEKEAQTSDLNEDNEVSPTENNIDVVQLVIYEALHIPSLKHDSFAVAPKVYVTCRPHALAKKFTTPISPSTTNPHWEYSSFVNISLQDVHELDFFVWSLPYVDEDEEDYVTEVDPKNHLLIGRAVVDLVPLLYGLKMICGWYNIVSLDGHVNGQLKVSVTPNNCQSLRTQVIPPKKIHTATLQTLTTDIDYAKWTNNTNNAMAAPGANFNLSILREHLKSHVQELSDIEHLLLSKLQYTSHGKEIQGLPLLHGCDYKEKTATNDKASFQVSSPCRSSPLPCNSSQQPSPLSPHSLQQPSPLSPHPSQRLSLLQSSHGSPSPPHSPQQPSPHSSQQSSPCPSSQQISPLHSSQRPSPSPPHSSQQSSPSQSSQLPLPPQLSQLPSLSAHHSTQLSLPHVSQTPSPSPPQLSKKLLLPRLSHEQSPSPPHASPSPSPPQSSKQPSQLSQQHSLLHHASPSLSPSPPRSSKQPSQLSQLPSPPLTPSQQNIESQEINQIMKVIDSCEDDVSRCMDDNDVAVGNTNHQLIMPHSGTRIDHPQLNASLDSSSGTISDILTDRSTSSLGSVLYEEQPISNELPNERATNLTLSDDIEEEQEVQRILKALLKEPSTDEDISISSTSTNTVVDDYDDDWGNPYITRNSSLCDMNLKKERKPQISTQSSNNTNRDIYYPTISTPDRDRIYRVFYH